MYYVFALLLFASSCKHEPIDGSTQDDLELLTNIKSVSPDGTEDYYILPSHTDLKNIPQDPRNPLTWEKVELGKMLFFETGIALDANHSASMGTYSCASCHIPSAGFLPGTMQGIADGGIGFGLNGEGRGISPLYIPEELDVQGSRPRSVMNSAFVSNTFWNGQFGGNGVNEGTEHLWNEEEGTMINHLGYMGMESQNIEGVKDHRMVMNQKVADSLGYAAYFNRAFPEMPAGQRCNIETTALAISAYLRTLTTDQAPFQEWLKGDRRAMTKSQKLGAKLFFGDAQCYFCHKSPSLQSNEFHAVGVNGIYQLDNPIATNKNDRRNLGRGGFTKKPEDYFKFQVPQLYNLKNAGFYFHGSSKKSIREVVEYFSAGVPENADIPASQISDRFQKIDLTEEEITNLTDFIENGLYDANYHRFLPEFILSGNCFPNNDPMSQVHLDCN